MSKLETTDYFLGLDCGTSSVGYAVTDEAYNILKFNGKAMWGSHVFNEAVPAENRRMLHIRESVTYYTTRTISDLLMMR